MSNQKKIIEADVRQAMRRALKRMLKEIENEPTPVIEPDSKGDNMSDETLADIQNWLFQGEVKP